MTTVALWRRLLAGVTGIAAAAALADSLGKSDRVIALLPAVLTVLAAITVHVPRLGPQLLARAVWWSNFALGVLIAVVGNARERPAGFAMATATAIALVAVGTRSLAEAGERDAFAPVAFRTTFLLLMMLTLADAQTLGLFGVATMTDSGHGFFAFFFFAGATSLVVAFIGLYRITLWGALLGVGTSAAVALAMPFVWDGKDDLRIFIWLLCGLEIAVGVPMIVAVLARKRLPEPPLALRTWGSRAVLAALWMLSAVCYLFRPL